LLGDSIAIAFSRSVRLTRVQEKPTIERCRRRKDGSIRELASKLEGRRYTMRVRGSFARDDKNMRSLGESLLDALMKRPDFMIANVRMGSFALRRQARAKLTIAFDSTLARVRRSGKPS
jgi:predicted nucleic acid-binding Zn ribbon protein